MGANVLSEPHQSLATPALQCVWEEKRLRDRLTSSSPSRTTSNHFLGGSATFLPFFAPDDDPSPASETRAFLAAGPAGTDASPLLLDAWGWSAVDSRGSKASDLRLGGMVRSAYTRWRWLRQSDGPCGGDRRRCASDSWRAKVGDAGMGVGARPFIGCQVTACSM